MAKVTPIKKNVELSLDDYIDEETGEVKILAEIPENTKVLKNSDYSIITSTDYAVLETAALMELTKILNNSDLANVIKMSVITKTPLNIIFNSNIPHTNETLQKYLEISSESMFMKLIKRLVTAGVLYQIKGRIYGEVRVCYMLNPFLSRKRKVFENKVFDIFEKFKTVM
jgi:hypothetical protein